MHRHHAKQLRTKEEWLKRKRFIVKDSECVGTLWGSKVYLLDQTVPFDSYSLEISGLIQDSFVQLHDDISCLVANKQELDEKIKHTHNTVLSIIEHLLEDVTILVAEDKDMY